MKNIPYVAGTALLLLAALVHIVAGELTNVTVLIQSAITAGLRAEWRAVWYIAGLDLLISGLYLFIQFRQRAQAGSTAVRKFIGLRLVFYASAFILAIVLTDAGLLFNLPQWILLALAGGLLLKD
jgi:hypothetical protein